MHGQQLVRQLPADAGGGRAGRGRARGRGRLALRLQRLQAQGLQGVGRAEMFGQGRRAPIHVGAAYVTHPGEHGGGGTGLQWALLLCGGRCRIGVINM